MNMNTYILCHIGNCADCVCVVFETRKYTLLWIHYIPHYSAILCWVEIHIRPRSLTQRSFQNGWTIFTWLLIRISHNFSLYVPKYLCILSNTSLGTLEFFCCNFQPFPGINWAIILRNHLKYNWIAFAYINLP